MNLAIFDIDGTLTNTNTVDEDCFLDALVQSHNICQVETDWGKYTHTTDSGITSDIFNQQFGRDPIEAELNEFKACFVKLLSEQYNSDSLSFAEIDGASAALDKLKQETEWAICFATGCWRESALLKLKAANIDIDRIPVAYAEDGLSREEILLMAVARSLEAYQQSQFEKIVSIGDGRWDVRTARNLEFGFIGIGSGESAEKLFREGAKCVVADYEDFDDFVRCLNEAEIHVGKHFDGSNVDHEILSCRAHRIKYQVKY